MPNASAKRRKFVVVVCVLALHLAVLWALQNGLMTRVVPVVVPVRLFSVTPAEPAAKALPLETAKSTAKATQAPAPQNSKSPVVTQVTRSNAAAEAPVLETVSDAAKAVSAPAGFTGNSSVTQHPTPASPGAISGAPAAARVELPSSDADYLHNPKPEYPRLSRLRNEQGKVVVNVLIGVDGLAQRAEIKVSSGYERLDAAALSTVKLWRYVPGKRGSVPEAMWYEVPIYFVGE